MDDVFPKNLPTAHLATRGSIGLKNGRMIRTPRRRRAIQRDRIVNETIRAVIEGCITRIEFLRRASNFVTNMNVKALICTQNAKIKYIIYRITWF